MALNEYKRDKQLMHQNMRFKNYILIAVVINSTAWILFLLMDFIAEQNHDSFIDFNGIEYAAFPFWLAIADIITYALIKIICFVRRRFSQRTGDTQP